MCLIRGSENWKLSIKPERVVPATVEIVDIAGLVKGASKGEGLGNKFLANIRETDAIIHVFRCFDNENIAHVDGKINPVRDKETVDFELQLKDLETVEGNLIRWQGSQYTVAISSKRHQGCPPYHGKDHKRTLNRLFR